MYGFKLYMPSSVPVPVWACKTSVDNYEWKNSNTADMIEFSYSRAVHRTVTVGECEPEVVSGELFSCVVGAADIKSRAEEGVRVEIASVAVKFPNLRYEEKELDESDTAEHNVFLIPHKLTGLSKQELSAAEQLLYRFIGAYMEHTAAAKATVISIIFELLSYIDKYARNKLTVRRDKYINYYTGKVSSIIENRFSERLTLSGVASELGISPNYLSAIYKASEGMGFCDKLCEARMKKAKELLEEGKLTLFEISQRVGLGDESHLRRRFKQYFGVSIKEYHCIDNELTLYHEKPEKK